MRQEPPWVQPPFHRIHPGVHRKAGSPGVRRLPSLPSGLRGSLWIRARTVNNPGEDYGRAVHPIEYSVVDKMKAPFAGMTMPFANAEPRVRSEGIFEKIVQFFPEQSLVATRQREKLAFGRLKKDQSVAHQARPALRKTRRPGIRSSEFQRRSISR